MIDKRVLDYVIMYIMQKVCQLIYNHIARGRCGGKGGRLSLLPTCPYLKSGFTFL
jgi:hypothetical protein